MKIVLPVDGSPYTDKALAFLVAHRSLVGPEDELLVLNVQHPLPPRVAPLVGFDVVADHHRDEAKKVLDPIEMFFDQHPMRHRCEWVVGSPATAIVEAAQREKADMIVMGTRGHGVFGRLVMGSVAQRVVAEGEVPVLLVK